MPRALIFLSVLAPALALGAPTAGDVVLATSDSSDLQTINRAQCTGTARNEAVGISDDVTADLTWTIAPAGTFSATGKYRIYVSNRQPAAGQKEGDNVLTSCTQNADDQLIDAQQVGSDIAVSTNQTTTRTGVSLSEIASKAGLGCDAEGTVYVCVQQQDGSNVLGYAVTSLLLDTTTLAAPTDVRARPGDGVLHVSCTKSDDESGGTFKAKAIPQNTTLKPRFSGEVSSCSGLEVSGLSNDELYDVVVYRLDDHHNPSDASAALQGAQPIPTDDYWDHYDGQETGGCNTAAGAAGLLGALGALATLAALRRRKS